MNIDTSAPVLVTGATGYVAGKLVKKLLKEGITVHAGVRDPENTEKLKYLNKIAQQEKGTIKYFKSDLLIPGSYDEAAKGCKIIFHTASPFKLNVKDNKKDLIEPAVKGTENVLNTAFSTHGVEKIVLTSSVASIYGDNADLQKIPNKTLTEEHKNFSSNENHQPYSYSKLLAEEKAVEMHKKHPNIKMVIINPALVIGPGINPFGTSESFNTVKQLADGTMKQGAPDFQIGLVDVGDVADAHFNAAYKDVPEGKYIIAARGASILELSAILQKHFGNKYPFPKRKIPKFIVWLAGPATGFKRKMIKQNIGYPWKADNTKSKEVLGINYRPIEESIVDFFEQMIENKVI